MAPKTTKAATPKAAKIPKAAAVQVKKDGKGRFWMVPKEGVAEPSANVHCVEPRERRPEC